jgi:hypothetical protein
VKDVNFKYHFGLFAPGSFVNASFIENVLKSLLAKGMITHF